MKKRFVLMLCVISCLLMITGCSLTKGNKNLSEETLSKTAEEGVVAQWFSYDFSSFITEYKDQMTEDQMESYKEYTKLQKKHGAMKKVVKSEYSAAEDSATVTKTVATEKGGKLVFTVTFDESGQLSDWKVEEYQSVSQIMSRAGLKTAMSMAIVFLVLIFISLLISSFKYISKAQQNARPKVETVQPPRPPMRAPLPIKAPDLAEENLAKDLELVAVITAAIVAANKNEYPDGLMVRSIIRRS